jgi:hypothetical protein
MTADIDIAAIEAELAKRGISVSRLLRRAEIAGSTWYRVKAGRTGQMRGAILGRVRNAYADLLAEHEAQPKLPATPEAA